MGAPTRQRLEFRINLTVPGKSGSGLPPNVEYRVIREIKRRAQGLGLKVYNVTMKRGKIEIDALIMPNMVKSNIERSLYGQINGILKRETPHLIKKSRSGGPSGFSYY